MNAFLCGVAAIPFLVAIARSAQLRAAMLALIASAGGEVVARVIQDRNFADVIHIGLRSLGSPILFNTQLLEGVAAGVPLGALLLVLFHWRRPQPHDRLQTQVQGKPSTKPARR